MFTIKKSSSYDQGTYPVAPDDLSRPSFTFPDLTCPSSQTRLDQTLSDLTIPYVTVPFPDVTLPYQTWLDTLLDQTFPFLPWSPWLMGKLDERSSKEP